LEVVLAESAGFCYGVKRALDTVAEAAKAKGKPMFTLGPLIHNPQVVQKLESRGVRTARGLEEVPVGSVLVMPSHGVPRAVLEQAKASGIEIIDLTCPFVSKVQQLAESLVSEGYQVVVLGDAGHTEVQAIMSRAGEDAIAVCGAEELANYALKGRVGILAQTTQTVGRYKRVVAEAAALAYEVRAYNTICNATTDRQNAAVDVARVVDVMVVVGGRNSANTRRLAEICAETGVPTHHVEVADEINPEWVAGARKAGVAAGASTPDWIIEEVIRKLKEIPPAA